MTRVAAIDTGTNSVRLLIADISGNILTDVVRRMEIVRLGQDVDRTGRLAPDALDRTFTAMRGYRELIDQYGVDQRDAGRPAGIAARVIATSATRDAVNRDAFVAGVREIFGVEPEVVTGAEEAHLSFTGATRGLAAAGGSPAEVTGPYLVADIGGGSTEFVLGERSAEAAVSLDIGCVRLTERHLRGAGDPPSASALAAVEADIEAALDRVTGAVPVERARTLVGLAGSVTTVAGIALDLPEYDPTRIHRSRITAAQVHEVTQRLMTMTHDERAAIGVMHPGRVDVIIAGALILDRVLRRFGFHDLLVSEHDILDGIAWSLLS